MGKKKGKGKSAKKGRKIVDGISTAEMSREQLIGHIKRLQTEIDREREERNFFMLEREKLFSLWSRALERITLEEKTARLKEIHLDNARERKEEEMELQKQKIRFLMTEHLERLGEARLDYLYRMKELHSEFWKVESDLRDKMTEKRKELSAARESLFSTIRQMQIQHCQNVTHLRKEYLDEIRRIEFRYDIETRKRMEVLELESKQDQLLIQITKDEQIDHLIKLHENQLDQLREFYNELIVNDLGIIETLQEELMERKSNEENLSQKLHHSESRSENLTQRLKELEKMNVDWSQEDRKMAFKIKEVKRMEKTIQRNKREKQMMELANEALIQENLGSKAEVEYLKRCLAKGIMEVQMKSTMSQILVQFQKLNN